MEEKKCGNSKAKQGTYRGLSPLSSWSYMGVGEVEAWTPPVMMEFGHIVFAVIGFSASFFFCVPNIKRWQRKHLAAEKLKMVNEALEAAEERAVRFQERHDRILNQICSTYLTNAELVEAIAGARATMNQALDFALQLRKIQFRIITSFPDAIEIDVRLDLDASKQIHSDRV